MLQEELKTIKVGDQVGVARSGSWHVMSEGIYTVEKSDKVKIVVTRDSDGYQRTFSAKTGFEKGATKWREPFLETVAAQEAREVARQHEARIRNAWRTLEEAATQKNLPAATAALALIAELTGK